MTAGEPCVLHPNLLVLNLSLAQHLPLIALTFAL
jgi:hypothetical protein